MMRLVNRYEELAHGEIKRIADDWSLSVYPKVRVADVISLDDVGATGDLKRYGLQSHFDFIVCRNQWDPIYAIEFDGKYHSSLVQKQRDTKKDELCRRADFPILRINSRYLTGEFGSMSLLAWIMDVCAMQEEFYDLQEQGSVPPDEIFDPFFLMSVEEGQGEFKYWFSAKPRIRMQQHSKQGRILDPVTSGLIGYDDKGVLHGIEFIRVTDEEAVIVRTAMRPQQFPIVLSELLGEILCVQLEQEVARWIESGDGAQPMSMIWTEIETMRRELKVASSHSYGPNSGTIPD